MIYSEQVLDAQPQGSDIFFHVRNEMNEVYAMILEVGLGTRLAQNGRWRAYTSVLCESLCLAACVEWGSFCGKMMTLMVPSTIIYLNATGRS